MENEIKVGDWIRTKAGQIHKVDKIIPVYENDKLLYEQQFLCWDGKISGYRIWQLEDIIVKHSSNLIDLIQCGDYVNGYKVLYVCNEEPCPSGKYVDIDCDKPSEESYFFDNQIETIVTKEMMESISYKV